MEYNANRDITGCNINTKLNGDIKLSPRFLKLLLKLNTYCFSFENCWHKDMKLHLSSGLSDNVSGINQKLKQKIVSDIITPE